MKSLPKICPGWCLLLVMLLAGLPRVSRAERPHLVLSHPRVTERGVVVSTELQGLFDDESLASLDSGVPATLVFQWVLRWERSGRHDPELARGEIRHRIVFDILEEKYFLFNQQGRPQGSCDALNEVEEKLCHQDDLQLGPVAGLQADRQYYIEMVASLSLLGQEEVRGFENWLMGLEQDDDPGEDGVSSVVAESSGWSSGFSGLALEMVKKVAGFSDPSVTGRSTSFHVGNRP